MELGVLKPYVKTGNRSFILPLRERATRAKWLDSQDRKAYPPRASRFQGGQLRVESQTKKTTYMKLSSLQLLVIGFCGHLVLAPAVAGESGKTALGGALGGAAGAVIGKQLGGDTGAVIGGAVGGGTGAAVTTKGEKKSGAAVGGALGGGSGAAAGNAIGGNTASQAIGAAVGAGAGGVLGGNLSK